MKNIFLLLFIIGVANVCHAQDFTTSITTAKAAYKAGNLEEAHFSLQRAMQEIDITIGKEVMKLMPAKMDTLVASIPEDNVSGNVGFVGATVHRSYGKQSKRADVNVTSNSPMVSMLNAYFTSAAFSNTADGSVKTVKVQGYKARLEKTGDNSYQLQVPMGSALVTLEVLQTNEAEILSMANTLPLAQIAKLVQ